MEKLNTKQIMINFMVKSMLNPSNKSFYIGSLTLETLNRVINGDSEMAEVVFNALAIAQARYMAELEERLTSTHTENICPECGCQHYYTGVVCPNCDYVEV